MKSSLLYIVLLISFPGLCQEYNYINYDTREGLASSTVYRITQDKNGYLWFATDNGVSRYDGKTFKNFTTKEGLTDNEVLFVDCDSKNRIWMIGFNNTLSYYYNGKVYSGKNDSTLANTNFKSHVLFNRENKKGEPYFQAVDGLFSYKNDGSIKRVADYKTLAGRYGLDPLGFYALTFDSQYGLVLYNNGYLFYEKNDEFVFLKKIALGSKSILNLFRATSDLEPVFFKTVPPARFNTISIIDEHRSLYNTMEGAWFMDSTGVTADKPFLVNKKVSHSYKDTEGSLWFSTLGEGLYKVTNKSVQTYMPGNEFLCIAGYNGKIYAGTTKGDLHIVEDKMIKQYVYKKKPFKKNGLLRLYTMKEDNKGNLYLGFDSHLVKYNSGDELIANISPIKSIDIIDENYIVVCTNFNTLKLRSKDLTIVDTIWKDRGTKVIYDKGLFYIGLLNGLAVFDSNKNRLSIQPNKSLQNTRVADMCLAPDGSLWIATSDNGVVVYKNGKMAATVNTDNGLNSNICKSLAQRGNYVWVGSNKGINKIDINSKKIVGNYGTAHGLSSEMINAVFAVNDTVWAATPAGLTFFDENVIQDSSICALDMHVIVSEKPVSSPDSLDLGYRENNISFNYTAVSFKSAGEIMYKYRLNGLDTSWHNTELNSVSYPSLPPGDYEFSLYAINKLGKKSDTARIKFSIAAPFWKTTWFWVAVAVAIFLLLWFLLNSRYKTLQRKENEKSQLAARVIELEQLSLRAQINPHFIFNCLTSIQSFILTSDLEAANRYIGEFGSLMRQTLDNSSQPVISISREINYMESYLKLEQMRFPSKFRFEINIDKDIEMDQLFVPSLFLQPFAENSIRHGIRHKREQNGFVKINIVQRDGHIICSVEDNGVGREVASQYKTVRHIEYQSKGIKLTLDRLNILTGDNKEKVGFQITDLADDKGKATGTKVTIDFPISIISKLSER